MKHQAMHDRTKQFALQIVHLYGALPKTDEVQVLGKQLLRSGTSAAANYREASRARSDAELISKLGIVEQELDESQLWMELLVESEIIKHERMAKILQECDERLRITVSSIKTLKSRCNQ